MFPPQHCMRNCCGSQVRADPKEFVEVDSFKALEGKTWNHPVVVGDKLYVRNSQEAAGFQLSTAKDAEPARKM